MASSQESQEIKPEELLYFDISSMEQDFADACGLSLDPGQELSLQDSCRIVNIGEGGYGACFRVSGWLTTGLNNALSQQPSDVGPCLDVCLKVYTSISGVHARDLEYDLLLKAQGCGHKVPRALAKGLVTLADGSRASALVMEYLQTGSETFFLPPRTKQDLGRFSDIKPGACSPLQALTFCYQLCLTLRDLHGKINAHRDLQPNNVAVRLTTNNKLLYPNLPSTATVVDCVFLIDLGNSVRRDDIVTEPLNNQRPRGATVAYGSPEMFDIDPADTHPGGIWRFRNYPTTDIWSVGTLAFTFYTDNMPPYSIPDSENKNYYRDACIAKKDGLTLNPPRKRKAHFDTLKKLIEDCTTYKPLERAERAPLNRLIRDMELALGISSEDQLTLNIERNDQRYSQPHSTVSVGPFNLSLPDSFAETDSHGDFVAFTRRATGDGQALTHLVCSCEKNVRTPEARTAYLNELIKRLEELFLKGNKEFGPVSDLITLRDHGATGLCTYEDNNALISFMVYQDDGSKILSCSLCAHFELGCALCIVVCCLDDAQEDDTGYGSARELALLHASNSERDALLASVHPVQGA